MTSLIDGFMPTYDVKKRYRIVVDAPRARAYDAVRGLDLGTSPIVRALVGLRELPAVFSRRADVPNRTRGLGATIDDLHGAGFVLLAERPGDEIVLGLVGKFWTPTGGIRRVAPEGYREFNEPGLAVVAWNFRLRAAKSGMTSLSTETRVRCTDSRSRLLFRAYWLLVGPFSGIIRGEALRSIKKVAEAQPSPPAKLAT